MYNTALRCIEHEQFEHKYHFLDTIMSTTLHGTVTHKH